MYVLKTQIKGHYLLYDTWVGDASLIPNYSSLPNKRTGLKKRTGWKKIKKLINAQGLIIIILYCLIRTHRVDFFSKKISAHVRLLGRPE